MYIQLDLLPQKPTTFLRRGSEVLVVVVVVVAAAAAVICIKTGHANQNESSFRVSDTSPSVRTVRFF